VSQRVILRLTEFSMRLGSFRTFLETAEKYGAGPRAVITYMVDSSGHPCLCLELPEKAAEALEKAVRPLKPTRAQEAVSGQLQARKEAVRTGQPVPGHVPAVAKGGKVLKVRKKHVRKPIPGVG
jgi:hypothetical protein